MAFFDAGFFETVFGYFRWVPNWVYSLVIFSLALLLALWAQRVLFDFLTRLTAERSLFLRSLVVRTHGPLRLGAIILALIGASGLAPMGPDEAEIIQKILSLCFIALAAWAVHSTVNIWMTLYLRRFKLEAEDNLLARKHVTQTRIMRRIASTLIIIVALSVALMTFESVRQYGVSLLASAGAAGLVVGLALQPVLKNIFAGVQLAITQPIRLDDALLIEGEWGRVEEITSTYVVIRIWDLRRLVIPISYFLEKPFQNWTRESASLIGSIMLYVDHSAPVETLRAKAKEIAENSPLWDRQVFSLAVTDFRERVMEIRVLISAGDSGRAFDLRCEMREKLAAFLQAEHPSALPRTRALVEMRPEMGVEMGPI